MQFSDKVFSYPLASPRIINNDCTDPQYKCTNGTCCKTFDGKFGCCPHEGQEISEGHCSVFNSPKNNSIIYALASTNGQIKKGSLSY